MTDRILIPLAAAVLLLSVVPAVAQQATGGQVASTTAGQIGQRQTREAPVAGIEPMSRLDNRIQNRLQSRLRTRIDRDYSLDANSMSPFETALDRTRAAGRTRQR